MHNLYEKDKKGMYKIGNLIGYLGLSIALAGWAFREMQWKGNEPIEIVGWSLVGVFLIIVGIATSQKKIDTQD